MRKIEIRRDAVVSILILLVRFKMVRAYDGYSKYNWAHIYRYVGRMSCG